MPKFIFSIGIIEKKSFLPLIYAISQIGLNIYKNNCIIDIVSSYLLNFGLCVGLIMTYFIGSIIKYKRKTTKSSKRAFLHYIKDYLILFLISLFYMIGELSEYAINNNDEISEEEKDDYSREIFFVYGIEIIILTIITYFWLRNRYYIHHLICIFIIVILTFIIDALLNIFSHIKVISIIGIILTIVADTSVYIYVKYLMEHKYYYNMDILYLYGIFNTIVHFLSLIFSIIVQSEDGNNYLIIAFYEFYKESGPIIMILRFLFGLFIAGIYFYMLEFLIIESFSPNYVIIGYEIGLLPAALEIVKEDYTKISLLIIIFIAQFAVLFFYLEIFECNFCSLNKNTRKQIYKRVENHLNLDRESRITFEGYDISEGMKSQELEMEKLEKQETVKDE